MDDHVTIIPSSLIDTVARETGALGLAVYTYLCRRADRHGRCYPALNTIADDLGLSRSSAIRYTKHLEVAGYLSRERRSTGVVWQVGARPSTSVTETLPVSQRHSTSVSVTPKVDTRSNTNSAVAPTPGFDQFWQAYPRKVGKAEALRAWHKMGLEPLAGMIAQAVRAHIDGGQFSPDPKYILYPVRWLTYRRFDDEAAAPDESGNRRDGRFLAG